ncbi:hypothetical protein ABLE92_12135 [Gordonia sp. VNQ95]|uniref:hypothetical protein n=1 Tax=Gordonia sp. VNQ95 TaxID=3156619 RepID=UPI0032B43C06
MKRASVLVVAVSAMGILLISGCATNDEPGAPSSSSAYASAPSSSAVSITSSTPAPSPAPVTETVMPPVATQTQTETLTETVPPPTQGSRLPPNLDRDGDGIQDEGAVGGGDTDDALCNDPNLADWAATSPSCQ